MRKTQRSGRSNPAAPPIRSAPGANLKRRGFLLTLGVGGVGAAAIAARSMTGTAIEAEPAATTSDESKGYAVTEHIRRYYRTAKV
jgi:hypothetical protein